MQKQLLPQAAGQRCDYSHRESCCPSPQRAESAGDSGADNGLQRGAERSLCSALDPPPRRPPAGRRGRDKSSSACSGARARVRPPGACAPFRDSHKWFIMRRTALFDFTPTSFH
ncbi:PREDICTED: uncharacterized protein KIAA1456 isoform-like [Colobus angolensis palliatus]|uniref:uncharacterized protein KIAA1456 isoform-like n=1 Tax=Colobus angolensis palliatus TaxID=336983 RepID=UPI0005F387BE|nr:PREDICTED: uncharacterized protein KIAA1456 isoform-like [Colobus angolensis palliatus]XP_011798190.1 PREDICTED: uncharacterized protein KIAA1456 isoform-like [Colobus angolensis palliatus]